LCQGDKYREKGRCEGKGKTRLLKGRTVVRGVVLFCPKGGQRRTHKRQPSGGAKTETKVCTETAKVGAIRVTEDQLLSSSR